MSLFPNRLRALREGHKATQSKLASIIGVTDRAFRHYEHGDREPNIDALIALADYFDVSLDYLVGRSDDPDSHKKQRNQLD